MEIETYANNKANLNWIHGATEKRINDKTVIIASTPAFQTAFNKFKANIVTIPDFVQQKSVALTGNKNNSKQRLCKLTANIAGFVYSYTSANSNKRSKRILKKCD